MALTKTKTLGGKKYALYQKYLSKSQAEILIKGLKYHKMQGKIIRIPNTAEEYGYAVYYIENKITKYFAKSSK